jgi:hypothetical protein
MTQLKLARLRLKRFLSVNEKRHEKGAKMTARVTMHFPIASWTGSSRKGMRDIAN